MAETRPSGEQIRFESSKTGSHILDTYLEAAQLGDRELADILSDIFDSSTGAFRADIFEFREDPDTAGLLQFRVGDFVDPDAGWEDITSTDFQAFVTACEAAQTAAELAETNATSAQTAAETAETNAETAETNAESARDAAISAKTDAETAQSAAEDAQTAAEAALDSFDDRYLGAKSSDPALDNDGNALLTGAIYWNTSSNGLRFWSGSAWVAVNVSEYLRLDGTAAMSGDLDMGSNDIVSVGDIDGRDVSADGSKLDTIESNATADQTGAEIKALYEAEADTNAYTDTEKSKLATIEDSATADQTGAEIKALYEAEADTNAFTDDDHSKLDGIEASADVTDTANVTSAGALMRSGGTMTGDIDMDGYNVLNPGNLLLAEPGAVIWFAANSPPSAWLECDGSAISRTTYAALFAVVGTTFGVGDGSTTFNLPDLRGEFVRGWDNSRGVDSGRSFGSAQSSQNLSHGHAISVAGITAAASSGSGLGTLTWGSTAPNDTNEGILGNKNAAEDALGAIWASGGAEARSRNIALLPCIKY